MLVDPASDRMSFCIEGTSNQRGWSGVLPLLLAGEARSCRRRRSGEGGCFRLVAGGWWLFVLF